MKTITLTRSTVPRYVLITVCAAFTAPHTAHAGLSHLAAPYGVRIGSMINVQQATEDAVYISAADANLNFMTIAQLMPSVEQSEGSFSFSTADRLLTFAEAHAMPVRFHALVYGKFVPQWVLDKTNTWTRAEAENILSNYITTVCRRYAGRIFCYDVVNENFWDDGSWRASPWLDGIGSNYVELAFKWARAADTNALLFYNDNYCEQINTKSTHILNFLTNLRANGAVVHGLGTQCHFSNGDYATGYGTLADNLDRYGANGLHVHVTELDCRISTNDGPTTAQFDLQYSNFYHFARGVLASTNRENITMWGFSDNYSWLQPGSIYMQGLWGWPCPFDYYVRPKPAYFGFRNALLPVLDEFLFDASGTTASNTGMTLQPVTLYNAGGTPADLHGGTYSGVNRGRLDHAFDNSAAGGMGSGFSGGLAAHSSPSALAGLPAFTLCGWFNAASIPGNNACLLADSSASTFMLDATGSGNLRLSVNGSSAATSGAPFAYANQWIFFAVTYTNSASDNVMFYYGSPDTSVAHVSTLTLDTGSVSNGVTGLCIGNTADRSQPFHGWLDNMRICHGCVATNILEALRADDVRDPFPLIAAYDFNETSGTAASNTGFATAPLALVNSSGAATDLHSAAGGGVSMLVPDRALDTTTATGMGDGFNGPRAQHASDLNAFDRLRSFTVCAWIKPSVPLRSNARIFDNGYDGRLMGSQANNNDLRFVISNTAVWTTGQLYSNVNEWTFLAVACDGTLPSNNVFFYRGAWSEPVTCVSTMSLGPILVQSDSATLYLANNSSYAGPFKGLMDNVRFYGTRYDDAAMLSLDHLEALRAHDAIPEPQVFGCLLCLLLLRARSFHAKL